MWLGLVLPVFCTPALAFSVPDIECLLGSITNNVVARRDRVEELYQPSFLCDWQDEPEAGQEEFASVLALKQCSERIEKEATAGNSQEMVMRDQARALRSSDSLYAFSIQATSAMDSKCALFENWCDMADEGLFAELDHEMVPSGLRLSGEWQGEEGASQGFASEQCLEQVGKSNLIEQCKENQTMVSTGNVKNAVEILSATLFVEEKSPKGFGKRELSQRFRGGSLKQMQRTTLAVGAKGVEEDDPDLGIFMRPVSPEEFVKRWPEQKRTFEGLPHPLTREQKRVLGCTFYKFTAAGQLLGELGEEAFLQKFGKGSVEQMKTATKTEIKQRGAAERKREEAERLEGSVQDFPNITIFASFKSPEDFVKRWPEHKRLVQSLPRPLIPEQRRILHNTYYPFTAAGQLLEELGKEEFLQRFGGGPVSRMQKGTVAEVGGRKTAERDRRVAESEGESESEGEEELADGKASKIAAFVRPASPKDFVKRWPRQKRLFERLPRPLMPEHRRVLEATHYKFAPAGQLLDELGEVAFLQRFGRDTVNQMQLAARAEIKQKKAVKGDQRMAGSAKEIENVEASVLAEFVRPKTPQDFVNSWAKHKRLYQSLSHPRTCEQRRVLKNAYYPFTAAGQLLEELGKEAFLEKFGEGTVVQMRNDTRVEIQQRGAAEKEKEMAVDAEETLGIATFKRPKSLKDFVERWPEQKRLFDSLPRPFSPEQMRALKHNYYDFLTAGKMLAELGKEAFLQKFKKCSVRQMQKATRAESRHEKAGRSDERRTAKASAKVKKAKTCTAQGATEKSSTPSKDWKRFVGRVRRKKGSESDETFDSSCSTG